MCGLTCKSISTVIDICKDGKEALGLRRCFLYVYVYIYVAYMYCTYTALAKTVKYFNADFANLRTSVTTNRLARAFVISPSARKLNAPRNPGPQDRNRVIPKINHFPVIHHHHGEDGSRPQRPLYPRNKNNITHYLYTNY